MAQPAEQAKTAGLVLHRPVFYDFLLKLITAGRERSFREDILRLAGLRPGEAVLDIGCGTGTLAITASRMVEGNGEIVGVDASPEMLRRARQKARRSRAPVEFQQGVVESLEFGDGRFDLVLSTVMMHHLPVNLRRRCAAEVKRVLKPGGRAMVVDFGPPQGKPRWMARFHRHSYVSVTELQAVLENAGLQVTQCGRVGVGDLHFVLATKAAGGEGV